MRTGGNSWTGFTFQQRTVQVLQAFANGLQVAFGQMVFAGSVPTQQMEILYNQVSKPIILYQLTYIPACAIIGGFLCP